MATVFLFPSQSARYPGMLEEASALISEGESLVDSASRTLGLDLWTAGHSFESNLQVQLTVFVANHLHLLAARAAGLEASHSLGASLGEWNHLVHIGALGFEEALRLVSLRGTAYDQGPKGERAVLFPMSRGQLEAFLDGRSEGVEFAGHLAPKAVLVGGDEGSLGKLSLDLKSAFPDLNIRLLGVKLPIHSSHFQEVARTFEKHLKAAEFRPIRCPYLPNALGTLLSNPTAEEFREALSRQVACPMLMVESVEAVVRATRATRLLEVGAGRTLTKLFKLCPDWLPEISKEHWTDLDLSPERTR